jgi:beta-lactam-binding protein with PASTA domain
MASQTYNFTHSDNSNFTTRVVLSDGSAGTVNYTITLRRSSTAWTSYNVNSAGNSAAPRYSMNILGTSTGTQYYTYDFRNDSTSQTTSRTRNSRVIGVGNPSAFRIGMVVQSGTGIPSGATITGIGSTTVTMSVAATSTGSGVSSWLLQNTSLSTTIGSGSVSVPTGTTRSISGTSDGKVPIGAATISGSFTTAGAPPAPPQPGSFSVNGVTTSSISTSWSSSSGATGYELFLNGSSIATTTSTSYNFSGLSSSTSYTVGVRAYTSTAGGTSYSATSQTSATTASLNFTTPSVIGQSRSVAINTLQSAGFGSVSVSDVTTGATSINNLLTFSQSPAAGTTATAGNSASIEVYDFRVAVPSIIGLTEAQALTTLTSSGFNSRSSSLSTSGATVSNNLKVGSQSPTAGTQFNPVNTVTFTIYNFLTSVPNVVGQTLDNAITALSNLGFVSISTSLDETGATTENVGTVKSQTPVNSGTTYNPADTSVNLTVYSLGVTGKRFTGTGFVALSNAKRFDGTVWQPITVAKRFNGTSWLDISN